MTRTLVTFAATTIAIEHEGELAAKLVNLLTRRLSNSASASAPKVTLTLRAEPGTDQVVLRLDGSEIARSRDAGDLAEHIHEHLAYHFADGCRQGLMVHSSAVVLDGRAMVFPAASGSGKSTLAAFLVSKGFSHMTDELCHVSEDGSQVSGWMRPFEVKHGSAALVEALLTAPTSEHTWLPTPRGRILSPELLGAHAATSVAHAALHAIVFPRYVKDQVALELRPLSAAETSAMLLHCTINARHLARHGLAMTAAAGRRAKGFALSYGSLVSLDRVLREALTSDSETSAAHG